MKIGILTETVFLSVNGNKPSTDNSFIRADIRALLPAAINYALDAAYNDEIRSEGDRDMPNEFYGYYEDIVVDRTGKRPSITMADGVVPLKGNQGIRFVFDDCDNYYAPLGDSDMATAKFWSERGTGSKWYRRRKNTIELWNILPTAKKVSYAALTDINSLTDEDEAPIQAGKEPMVIEMLSNLVRGKVTPYDNKIDSRDDVNAVPYK